MAREKTLDEDALFAYFNEIGVINQLSTNMFEQKLPDGLTLSQFGVLNWFVRVDSQASPGRLAKAFQVTGGAMTNTLKKLEARKLIRIGPDALSGRRKKVTLTAKGKKQRDAAIAAVGPLLREFATAFDTGKLRRQTTQLASVRQYLDEYRYR